MRKKMQTSQIVSTTSVGPEPRVLNKSKGPVPSLQCVSGVVKLGLFYWRGEAHEGNRERESAERKEGRNRMNRYTVALYIPLCE